jgi:hypothetical protein
MLNSLLSRIIAAPGRWLLVPALGGAAVAALAALAVSASGLPFTTGVPAAATSSCVSTQAHRAALCLPSPPVLRTTLPVSFAPQPAPLVTPPRFTVRLMPGSPMTPAQRAQMATRQADLRAALGLGAVNR